MGHEIDLKRYDIRTDLVIDTIDNNDDNIDTLVEVQGDIKITKVTVDDNVSRIIGKKKGRYITIEFDDDKEDKIIEEAMKIVAGTAKNMGIEIK